MTYDDSYKIAWSAGKDAADRNMRKANRHFWSDDDYRLACEVFSSVLSSLSNNLEDRNVDK